MAQYEKLINLSLLNQFLTKAKTIFTPKITASGILKGDGNGGVSAAEAGTDYATPAQSLALGLTGASVGDLVRVNAVDATGKPTSWKHVPLNEIKCNKNLLDNWYFVGGGSQLGDGVFPINQRGQTVYSGSCYGIDRWVNGNSHFNVDIASSAINIYSVDNATGNTIRQYIPNASALLGKTITISIIINGALSYRSFKLPDELPENGSTVGQLTIPSIAGASAVLRVLNNKLCYVVYATSSYVPETALNITAVKLELGSEQTLCHNEGTAGNPVWVLNEIPDYGEELLKCQRYLQILDNNVRMRTVNRLATGGKNILDFCWPLSTEMYRTPSFINVNWYLTEYGVSGDFANEYTFSIIKTTDAFLVIQAIRDSYDGVADAQLYSTTKAFISCEP